MRTSLVTFTLIFWVTHCGETGTLSSSESHFLGSCDGSHACAQGLECVCGLCTEPCRSDDDCSNLDGSAECLAHEDVSCEEAEVCDVSCTVDADCGDLGSSLECASGRCRAASALSSSTQSGGADGGSDGSNSSGKEAGTGTMALPDGGCSNVLGVTYRDFKALDEDGGHPDFEISARGVMDELGLYKGWNEVGCGLVEATLGPNDKPVFYTGPAEDTDFEVPRGAGRLMHVVTGPGCWTPEDPEPPGICYVGTCEPWSLPPPTYEIESRDTFDQWYNTIEDVNIEIQGELTLKDEDGLLVFDSQEFFPLDSEGFGTSPGFDHNYHFTTEIHLRFTYEQGQYFTFRGDDDVWVFVNGRLALDIGGVHQALEGTIDLYALDYDLGIEPGGEYRMDIFHAERQSVASRFRIETNIPCFSPGE